MARIQRNRLIIAREGLLRLATIFEHVTALVVSHTVFWPQPRDTRIQLKGPLRITFPGRDLGVQHQRIDMVCL